MENKETYLTKDVLGNLSLRVAKSLPCLKAIDDASLWEMPVALCQRVEANEREVDNVILEARKVPGYFSNNSNNPSNCQVLLVRVYILLYYRHCDEELYKEIVFPELQNNMGIYREKYLDDIQSKVKKVLEIDHLIKQSRQEKKKNIKPKYSITNLRSGEADEYFSEFSNERLFNSLCDILELMKRQYFNKFDVASIWLTAKDVVQKLWQENFPENFIDRIFHKLSLTGGTGYVEQGASEAVLLCAYAMMRTVSKSDHFRNAIEYIENIPNSNNDYDLLYSHINTVKELMDEDKISFDDYDYTGGLQQHEETFTKVEVERMIQNQKSKMEQTYKQIIEQEKNERERLLKEKEELQSQLDKNNVEIKRLNYEFSELEKKMKTDTDIGEPLEPIEQLGIDERIIFFSSALRADITGNEVNKTQLANFIVTQTGDKPGSVRSRIEKIATMQKLNNFSDGVKQAAKNVIDSLNKCFKKNPNIEEVHLNSTTSDIIDDIEMVFNL